jgi:hypothetical protein
MSASSYRVMNEGVTGAAPVPLVLGQEQVQEQAPVCFGSTNMLGGGVRYRVPSQVSAADRIRLAFRNGGALRRRR